MYKRQLVTGEQHLRPGGTVSGPTLFTLADVAFYLLILSRIGPEALTVTTGATINFMRKPAPGVIHGDARILKQGKSLIVGDVMIYNDADTDRTAPVAQAQMLFACYQTDGKALCIGAANAQITCHLWKLGVHKARQRIGIHADGHSGFCPCCRYCPCCPRGASQDAGPPGHDAGLWVAMQARPASGLTKTLALARRRANSDIRTRPGGVVDMAAVPDAVEG